MGSLEDQAYVIADAGIETLIFDPDTSRSGPGSSQEHGARR